MLPVRAGEDVSYDDWIQTLCQRRPLRLQIPCRKWRLFPGESAVGESRVRGVQQQQHLEDPLWVSGCVAVLSFYYHLHRQDDVMSHVVDKVKGRSPDSRSSPDAWGWWGSGLDRAACHSAEYTRVGT